MVTAQEQNVHYRIGSLENVMSVNDQYPRVHYRIGSLEITKVQYTLT